MIPSAGTVTRMCELMHARQLHCIYTTDNHKLIVYFELARHGSKSSRICISAPTQYNSSSDVIQQIYLGFRHSMTSTGFLAASL